MRILAATMLHAHGRCLHAAQGRRTEPRPEGLLGMEGAVAGTAPMSKIASLTLTSHSRRWSSLPFETPNATLPQILDKIGSKADETGASGVPN
jgi:hypothetical protein